VSFCSWIVYVKHDGNPESSNVLVTEARNKDFLNGDTDGKGEEEEGRS
jgi:hypothetical protein